METLMSVSDPGHPSLALTFSQSTSGTGQLSRCSIHLMSRCRMCGLSCWLSFRYRCVSRSSSFFPASNSQMTPREVKVRFQNPSVTERYRSTFHALTIIARQEGIRAWYRGISSPLVCSLTAPPVLLSQLNAVDNRAS